MRQFIKLVNIVTLIVLLALNIGPAEVTVQAAALNAQPALVQMAARQPEQQVAVIVQKLGSGLAVEENVARLGGVVTQNLQVINAVAARLSAKAALELARQPQVRWVSLDAPVEYSGGPLDTRKMTSAFVKAVGAERVWNEGPAYLQGQGMTVAVVDSGDCRNGSTERACNDLRTAAKQTRILASASFVNGKSGGEMSDGYGHGSLVEGIIAGNGNGSGGDGISTAGKHMGIAPNVNLVNVKVADSNGTVLASDVVSGLQWVLENKAAYNIRVVNLSLNSTVPESYRTNPIAAACEILWFNGIVVVVSAGNKGSANLYPPANDPFVITVGATDDKGTAALLDDTLATFSAYGMDEMGAVKPELVAPGTNLISFVPVNENRIWKEHKSNYIKEYASQEYYMRVSGTSFSAPVVSGAVALLLQDEPNLTPDQVKYRLMATANKNWPGYNPASAGAGYLDIYAAVHGATTQSANTGLYINSMLTASIPADESYIASETPVLDMSTDANRVASESLSVDSVAWNSVAWNSVAWNSVAWNSVAWNSVAWNSVAWNSVAWNSVGWNSDYWGK